MIAVSAKVTAAKGKEKEIEQLLCDNAAKVNANREDALMYIVHRSVDDPCVFLLYEQYRDENHIELIHRQTPYAKALRTAIHELLACPPEVARYETL